MNQSTTTEPYNIFTPHCPCCGRPHNTSGFVIGPSCYCDWNYCTICHKCSRHCECSEATKLTAQSLHNARGTILAQIAVIELMKNIIAELRKVEWTNNNGTLSCPHCHNIKPGQPNANYKAQQSERDVDHAEDCPWVRAGELLERYE